MFEEEDANETAGRGDSQQVEGKRYAFGQKFKQKRTITPEKRMRAN